MEVCCCLGCHLFFCLDAVWRCRRQASSLTHTAALHGLGAGSPCTSWRDPGDQGRARQHKLIFPYRSQASSPPTPFSPGSEPRAPARDTPFLLPRELVRGGDIHPLRVLPLSLSVTLWFRARDPGRPARHGTRVIRRGRRDMTWRSEQGGGRGQERRRRVQATAVGSLCTLLPVSAPLPPLRPPTPPWGTRYRRPHMGRSRGNWRGQLGDSGLTKRWALGLSQASGDDEWHGGMTLVRWLVPGVECPIGQQLPGHFSEWESRLAR